MSNFPPSRPLSLRERVRVRAESAAPALRMAALVVMATSVLAPAAPAADGDAAKTRLPDAFFAFDNGTGRGVVPLDQQAKMLKELGYDGIGYTGTQRIPEMLAALDAVGLKMFSVNVNVNINPGKPPYDPGLKTAIEQLKGRDTILWLQLLGGKPSSDTADDRVVPLLREIADWAAKAGIRVALYPHVNSYVQRVDDCIRVVKKVDRKNVGGAFNLCHFLKCEDEQKLESRLKEVMPYLFVVSINGADGGETNRMKWDRLIQTLDRGTFDVGRVLRTLKQSGYTGPIALQCYLVPGDMRDNLARSIAAWRKLSARAEQYQAHAVCRPPQHLPSPFGRRARGEGFHPSLPNSVREGLRAKLRFLPSVPFSRPVTTSHRGPARV
jgi:sugar phosphate isomerase/epimerase